MAGEALHTQHMTEAPVRGLILSLAVPTIASMLISAFYNIVDTWFVGRLDTQSVAAVGIAFPAMALIQSVGFFFGHGSGNTLARMLGAGDAHGARRMAAVGLGCSTLSGVALAVVGLLFLRPLTLLMGSTSTILPYAEPYLAIILLGAPMMCAALTLNNQLRFQGKAALAMVGIISGAVLNCLLDPLFIFVFNWGVAGAAAATVVGQCVSLALLWTLNRHFGVVPVRVRNFRPSKAALGEIVRGGTPSLFRQGLATVAVTALNHAAGIYGDAAIAGMSIVTRLTQFLQAALIGFGQGFQPVCGFAYGAQKWRRIYDGFRFLVQGGAGFLLAVAVICWIWAPETVACFREDDPQVIAVGAAALRWQMATMALAAWVVPCNMLMQTLRQPVRASLLAASRQGLFFIPAVTLLSWGFGLAGVEASQAVADLCAFLFALPLTLPTLRYLRKNQPFPGAEI